MADPQALDPAPAGDTAEVETVTRECDTCGQAFTGPPGGRNSAAFLLAKHRWAVHGERSANPRRKKTKPPTAAAAGPVTSIADSLADVASAAGTRKGPPTAGDLGSTIGSGLSIVSLMAASWAVDTTPEVADSPQRDDVITALSLSPKSAQRIAAPLGRILAPTRLNQKHGRTAVDNADILPAIAELGEVARSWVQFLRLRHPAPTVEPAAAAAGPGLPIYPPTPNGTIPPNTTPDPWLGRGVVISGGTT